MSDQPDGAGRIAVSAEAQLSMHLDLESFYRNRILVLEELLRRKDQTISEQLAAIEVLRDVNEAAVS